LITGKAGPQHEQQHHDSHHEAQHDQQYRASQDEAQQNYTNEQEQSRAGQGSGEEFRNDGQSFRDQFGNKISATPFKVFDVSKLPRRQWLYGRHYVRKYVTATVASGGGAKTALKLVEAVSMAIGRDLFDGSKPIDRLRVWYWNGEDPLDEINRRIAAICAHYSIEQKELEGWLFVDSGHEVPICLATENRNGVSRDQRVIDSINNTIELQKIDVLILDPFISIHKVSENNNPLIDKS